MEHYAYESSFGRCGAKRVVITSSFAAVGYSHLDDSIVITEKEWTKSRRTRTCCRLLKSKTLAEKAAWDFIEKEGGNLELSVINPVGIFGPSLGPDMSSGLRLSTHSGRVDESRSKCHVWYCGRCAMWQTLILRANGPIRLGRPAERFFLAIAGDYDVFARDCKAIKK